MSSPSDATHEANSTSPAKTSISISGPDDWELQIQPSGTAYVWQIHNGSLRAARDLRLEITSVESFDAGKRSFREPTASTFRWPVIRDVPAGFFTAPVIFVRFEGNQLGFWNAVGKHLLTWPTGDPSPTHRWRLGMKITGLPSAWLIQLDMIWTLGTHTIDLIEYTPSETQAPGGVSLKSPEELGPHPEDPIGDNPCPKGHPAYKIWEDATRIALAEVFRLNQTMLEKRTLRDDELRNWSMELAFRKFQIWAKRGLSIVRNVPGLRG